MFIEPLNKKNLLRIFNKEALELINYFICKSIFSQPDIKPNQKNLPIHIPKEHLEQWLVQALNVSPVGSGSYPIDIINNNRSNEELWGADAKMLAWNGKENALSGETSLAQKFKGSGTDLDNKFINENYTAVIEEWKKILSNKYSSLLQKFPNIQTIYFFFFIRENYNFHLCGMKLILDQLDRFSLKKSSGTSIWVNNVIDEELGEVKIYKSKKRMELRLRPFNWYKNNYFYSFNYNNINIDKVDLLNTKNLKEHAIEHLKYLLKNIL